MRKLLVTSIICLPVFGCSSIGGGTSADAIACGVALAMTGVTDPAALALAAFQTPACQALAKDVLDAIIKSTSSTNATAVERNSAARSVGVHRR